MYGVEHFMRQSTFTRITVQEAGCGARVKLYRCGTVFRN